MADNCAPGQPWSKRNGPTAEKTGCPQHPQTKGRGNRPIIPSVLHKEACKRCKLIMRNKNIQGGLIGNQISGKRLYNVTNKTYSPVRHNRNNTCNCRLYSVVMRHPRWTLTVEGELRFIFCYLTLFPKITLRKGI